MSLRKYVSGYGFNEMISYEASGFDECIHTARLTLSPLMLLVTDDERGLMALAGKDRGKCKQRTSLTGTDCPVHAIPDA